MKIVQTSAAVFIFSSSIAFAGGFELQTLDTSIMYAEGNAASISIANINANVSGTKSSTVDTVKDQQVTNVGLKMNFGKFDLGLYTYRSGSIQLSGGNNPAGNYAPTGDIDINSTTLMAAYNINENMSLLGGLTYNNLASGNVTTIKGSYEVTGTSSTGYLLGGAYSIPDIAFRAEVLYQPKSKLNTMTAYDATGGVYDLVKGLINGNKDTEINRPETLTLNLQSGIAKDTLILASYHRAKWSGARVFIDGTQLTGVDPRINETFGDSEKFTIGVGRKFSEQLSGSLSYSNEKGGGDTSTSLFTFSNGTQTLSAGLRYTIDNMDISFGVSHAQLGDVTVNGGLGNIVYDNNSVTSMGVKFAYAF